MFTGIVEGLGKISSIRTSKIGGKISITSNLCLSDVSIGNSIAVNGACLTATEIQGSSFDADISPETLEKTVLNKIKVGEVVNLERALRLSDRLNGHLVSGHIDGIGSITNKKINGNATIITFSVAKSLLPYIIEKGSIAIDGTSLTINTRNETSFTVSIIPHTMEITTLSFKKVGSKVNIETDIVGKYIEQFLGYRTKSSKNNLNEFFLAKNGFI